jgi:hypothetical protein
MGAGKVVVFISNLNEVDCNDIISTPTAAETPHCCEKIAIMSFKGWAIDTL